MQITFVVTAEVEKQAGKFVSRDEISDEIVTAIDDANPLEIEIDESVYEIVAWKIQTV